MRPLRILVHANCGRVGIQRALHAMIPELDIRTTYNVSKDGAVTFREAVTSWHPDILLFQEHKLERAEAFIPGQHFADFVRLARNRIRTVSWVHPFNLALWPWATKTAADMIDKGTSNWRTCTRLIPEEAARIRAQAKNLEEARALWNAGELDFNFEARLKDTQEHHDRNEEAFKPSVMLGPWLKQHFKRTRLWWNGNHPTGEWFLELLRQVCSLLDWPYRPELLRQLPGDWTGADGAWPHSRYDHAFFQFGFMTEDLAASADCYWRKRLEEIWGHPASPGKR